VKIETPIAIQSVIESPALVEIKTETVTITKPAVVAQKFKKGERNQNQPFRRVKEEDAEFHDDRLRNNAFEARVRQNGSIPFQLWLIIGDL